eukprot:scaffold9015_cov96-Isochrysis_galbana.AAC.10
MLVSVYTVSVSQQSTPRERRAQKIEGSATSGDTAGHLCPWAVRTLPLPSPILSPSRFPYSGRYMRGMVSELRALQRPWLDRVDDNSACPVLANFQDAYDRLGRHRRTTASGLINFLHEGALRAVLLQRRQLIDAVGLVLLVVDREAELDHAVDAACTHSEGWRASVSGRRAGQVRRSQRGGEGGRGGLRGAR